MAFYETINLVAGDDKPELTIFLKDSNSPAEGVVLDPCDSSTWAPIDVTEPTIIMKFRALGTSTVLDTLISFKIPPYINGEIVFFWGLTTLDVKPGLYEGEIVLTYSSGRVQSMYDKLKFKIRGGN